MKSKRGISGVVTAVIMIALVIAASSIVWTVVNNLVKNKLDEAGSCFDTFEKVTINSKYTCYSSSSNEFQFSIRVAGDIDLTSLLVSVSGQGESKSFKLTPEGLATDYLFTYPKREQPVYLPKKGDGRTYILNLDIAEMSRPESIQVAPLVGGKQCEVSDSLQQIDSCELLIFN
jgi:flagellin-like protein